MRFLVLRSLDLRFPDLRFRDLRFLAVAGRTRFARLAASVAVSGLAFGASPSRAMEFATVPISAGCEKAHCPRAMIAEGEITADAPQRFRQFVQGEMRVPGLHALLFINSPGGNVESALKLGGLLHDAGASVVVGRPVTGSPRKMRGKARAMLDVQPGHCASACVYTLMGAKRRIVPKGARLGVHRMSARLHGFDPAGGRIEVKRIFAGESEIGLLRSYAASVGGSQDLITLAESTPHDRIRVLTGQEIRRYLNGAPSL